MAGHFPYEKRRLIQEKIQRTIEVAEYLRAREIMNDHYLQEHFEIKNETDRRRYLIDIIEGRGEDAFDALVDALVATNQFELAKALNPNVKTPAVPEDPAPKNPPSSRDGNCVSSGEGRKENSSEEGSSSTDPTEQLLLKPPTAEAIKENEEFYRLEKSIYAGVPATDGIFTDLAVKKCGDLPAGFNQDECYRHFSNPKGLAIIFNNRRFNKQRFLTGHPLSERLGTDVDCKNMEQLLKQLGYQVKIKVDLTSKEIREAMARFSWKSEHATCDSAVVVVLTHGTHGQLYGSDGELIPIEHLVSFLNGTICPALKNKPKLFIIQACRGDRFDDGVDSGDILAGGDFQDSHGASAIGGDELARAALLRKLIDDMDEADAQSIAKTPTDADILIAYATTPGYVSWRNTQRGSWFIQAICEIFSRHAHREEILHLFTMVNNRVSEQLSCSGHKQIPEPASRLRKKFYLLPGL